MWRRRSKRLPTQIEIRNRHLQRLPRYLVETPFEWLVSIMCILGAISQLTATDDTGSLARIVPEWMALTWGVALLLGGVSLFLGLTWTRWLELQRVGYGLLGSAVVVYGLCIVAVAGTRTPATTIGLYVVFAAVCGVRRYQLTTVRKIAEYRTAKAAEDE